MLGYTIYRNVIPYPDRGTGALVPVVAFGWLILVTVAMLVFPGLARKIALGLADADSPQKEQV